MSGGLREVLALYLDDSSPGARAAPGEVEGPAGAQAKAGAVLAIPDHRGDLVEPALLRLLADALEGAGVRVAEHPAATPRALGHGSLLGNGSGAPPTDTDSGNARVDFFLAPFDAAALGDPAAPLPPLDRVLVWIAAHPAGFERAARLLEQLARRRPGALAELVFLGARNPAEAATVFRRLAQAGSFRDRELRLRHVAALPSGPWLARLLLRGTPREAPPEFARIARELLRGSRLHSSP